jgi:hypothetical protein
MVLRLPKKKSKSPLRIGKQLQDYIDKNPGRMTNKYLKIARDRKPTGVINIDDFYNAKDSGILAGTGFRKKTQSKGPAGKVMKKKRGGSIKK